MLFEFFNSNCLVQSAVENSVVGHHYIALLTNLDHCTNNFILNKKRVKTEVTKLLREFMFWNWHLTKIWNSLSGLGRWQSDISRNDVLTLLFRFFHGLFHNDLVHRAAEINLHFVQNTCGLDRRALL